MVNFELTGFTQALAAEGKEHGIRALVIYLGAMATHWGNWTPECVTRQLNVSNPDRRR
jgi:NAD(P)-dependent dehydrogenase (short-subunit alcohol dehydrogenase family)